MAGSLDFEKWRTRGRSPKSRGCPRFAGEGAKHAVRSTWSPRYSVFFTPEILSSCILVIGLSASLAAYFLSGPLTVVLALESLFWRGSLL